MTEMYAPPGCETNLDDYETLRPGNGPLSILRSIKRATLEAEITLNKNRELQQIIFDGAIGVACDWLEATDGEAISEEVFQNLYDNGYASNPLAEILEIFYDWEDYQTVAQSYFVEREDSEAAKEALVENLRQEAAVGLIPTVFFDKYETYRVENPSGKKKLARYRVIDEVGAEDDTILQRYYKYLVVNHVTRNQRPEDEISEERKINLALGFTLKTKKPLSGFYAALRNSIGSLTEEQLMLTVEELGAYDYIYPDSRKRHLQTLVEVGYSEPETLNQIAA